MIDSHCHLDHEPLLSDLANDKDQKKLEYKNYLLSQLRLKVFLE